MSNYMAKNFELNERLPYNSKFLEVPPAKPRGIPSSICSGNSVPPLLPSPSDISDFSFKEFCERMTSHGLIDFYLAQSLIAKLFWLIVVICSLILTGYYIYDEISEYIECPILTTISFKPQLALPFPMVYICPFQFAYWDFINKCGNTIEFMDQSSQLKSGNNFAKILGGKPNQWHQVATLAQELIADSAPVGAPPYGGGGGGGPSRIITIPDCPKVNPNETFQDYIIRQAITIPMFLRECSFISKEMNCSEITTQVLDKEFGVCFLIDLGNQGDYSKQNTANLGLSLLIDVQQEQADNFNFDELPVSLVEGALVRVLDRNDPAAYGGHLIEPGTYTKMSLSATQIELISYIESLTPQQCTVNDKYDFSVLKDIGYTQDSCRMDCALDLTVKLCKCTLPVDRRYLNPNVINFTKFDQICNSSTFKSCVLPGFNASDEYKSCINHCFKACSSLDINVESSQAKFPSKEALFKISQLGYKFRSPYVDPFNMNSPGASGDDSGQPQPPYTGDGVGTDTHLPSPDIYNGTDYDEIRNAMNDSTDDYENRAFAPNISSNYTNYFPYNVITILEPIVPPYQGALGQSDLEMSERWSNNLIVLDIAYNNLEYTVYEQRPSRTYTSLVANVGGQAGLWTGASIFTVFQLILFSCYLACNRRPRVISSSGDNSDR